MKLCISLGVLALAAIGVAAVLHPASMESRIQARRVEFSPLGEKTSEESPRITVPAEAPLLANVRVDTPRVENETLPARTSSAESWTPAILETKVNVLERELNLTPDQRRRMEQILARREQEIAELQRGIVNSGVFRVREYDYQVRQLQAVSYEEIAGVLDGAQRRRWATLMAEGRLGDAVLFEILPTLVVLQD